MAEPAFSTYQERATGRIFQLRLVGPSLDDPFAECGTLRFEITTFDGNPVSDAVIAAINATLRDHVERLRRPIG